MEFELFEAEFARETMPLVARAESTLLAIERSLELGAPDEGLWREVLSLLHTIKGNAGMVRFQEVQELAHAMEDRAKGAKAATREEKARAVAKLLAAVDGLKSGARQRGDGEVVRAALRAFLGPASESGRAVATGASPSQTARAGDLAPRVSDVYVGAAKLDRLLELAGELTTHHGQVATVVRSLCDRLTSTDEQAAAALEIIEQLGAVVGELRDGITDVRLLPLGASVLRFERLIRDLCVQTGKRASLHFTGAETVVDKTIVDAVGEPLLHILRNAIDHGIEAPAARVDAGKPPEGRIELAASQHGGELLLLVRDDGRGIDRPRLIEKARAIGIEAADWSEDKVLDLVFAPELSTSEHVTDISGRGIGLDAAKRAVERIGGSLQVESKPGRGTEFRVRVPLTLTIQRTLAVRRCREVFLMPMVSVVASVRAQPASTFALNAGSFMRWRGALVPLYDLGASLAVPGADEEQASLCVLIEDGARQCGLLVDEVLGQREIVLKELDPVLGRPPGVAGATVLGDGRVAMVVDPRAIAAMQRVGLPPSSGRTAREELS